MFKRNLLELVLSGLKTQTRRLHKHTLKEGQIYTLKKNWYKNTGEYIKITRVAHQRLGDITKDEAEKEGFRSIEEFRQAWIRINGSWDPDMEVVVYDFELADSSQRQSRLT
uniref:Putative ASCH domain-containing protein n=1 Tax=viral metagenome TaxID=1070528 RepID=A0A6M3M9Q3_9ZZZZ